MQTTNVLAKSQLDLSLSHNLANLQDKVLLVHPELKSEIDNLMLQYRKFIYLCGKSNLPMAVPSEKVDYIWHLHLQQNWSYNPFCLEVADRIVIHRENDQAESVEDRSRSKQNLIDTAFQVFGYFPFDLSLLDCSTCKNGCVNCNGD